MENNTNITDNEFIEAILYCGPVEAGKLINSFVIKNVSDNGIDTQNETCKKFFMDQIDLYCRVEFWKFRTEFLRQTTNMNLEKSLTQDEIKAIGIELATAYTVTIKTHIDSECIECQDFRS